MHGARTVEFTNVVYHNLGDCLMLLAARQSLQERLPRAKFMAEVRLSEAEQVYYDLKDGTKRGVSRRIVNKLARNSPRRILNILQNSWIPWSHTTLVHISGYCYGDPWGLGLMRRDLAAFRKAKREGKKVILLPKTFGPFNSVEAQSYIREICDTVDLCLARDEASFATVTNIIGKNKNVQLYPDYTGGLNGIKVKQYDELKGRVCIIPNVRMVENLGLETEIYVARLSRLAVKLTSGGYDPFLLIHDTVNDSKVAAELKTSCGIPLVNEGDPLKVKGIIGNAMVVISSRLHGVINGLSQGVPVVAIGWCHKYGEVMRDYGLGEWTVEGKDFDMESVDRIYDLLSSASEERRIEINRMLCSAQIRINELNNRMWDTIVQCIAAT